MKCPAIVPNKVTQGNSLELMNCLPDNSVDLVITSPPYANKRKKHYNSINANEYKDWFVPFAKEIKRILKPTGSFVMNIKEHVEDGNRHPYVFDTVKAIQENGLNWNETYMWLKKNPYPIKPVRRMKDAFEYIYHFSKTDDIKFNPDSVMIPSNPDTCARYKRGANQKTRNVTSPTNDIYKRNWKKISKELDCTKSYPSNVLTMAVGRGRAKHPARFPSKLPEFFIKLLSDAGDVVLDPFAGGGTTNVEAKKLCRKTMGFDLMDEYVKMSNERLEKTIPSC